MKCKKEIYKVAVNTGYGMFQLSEEAIDWLLERGLPEKYILSYYYGEKRERILVRGFPRHHPLLIECIETLGKKARAKGSKINIEEIEEPIYRIKEYDGQETIETKGCDSGWTSVFTPAP